MPFQNYHAIEVKKSWFIYFHYLWRSFKDAGEFSFGVKFFQIVNFLKYFLIHDWWNFLYKLLWEVLFALISHSHWSYFNHEDELCMSLYILYIRKRGTLCRPTSWYPCQEGNSDCHSCRCCLVDCRKKWIVLSRTRVPESFFSEKVYGRACWPSLFCVLNIYLSLIRCSILIITYAKKPYAWLMWWPIRSLLVALTC